jgi:hypothetical protein
MENLLKKLDNIAQKNGDEFRYNIGIRLIKGKPYFEFSAEETTDQHCFVGGSGSSIEEAVQEAENNIESSCESWGYEL